MSEAVVFTEDEKDLLKELMNIAHGNATAVIADILEQFATLSIPDIDIYNPGEIEKYFLNKHNDYTMYAKQPFNGAFSGETMLFIDDISMENLSKCLGFEEEEVSNEEIILELMNILNSTLINRLAQEMGTEVSFALPAVETTKILSERLDNILSSYTQIIIIHTQLEFEKNCVNGEIAIFTKDKSLEWLHTIIKKMVEDIMG